MTNLAGKRVIVTLDIVKPGTPRFVEERGTLLKTIEWDRDAHLTLQSVTGEIVELPLARVLKVEERKPS